MIDGSEKRNRQLTFELQNSHVSEKRSKPENLQRKGEKKKCEEKERRRRRKAMVAILVFILATMGIAFDRKINCSTQKVHLAITLSKRPARCMHC